MFSLLPSAGGKSLTATGTNKGEMFTGTAIALGERGRKFVLNVCMVDGQIQRTCLTLICKAGTHPPSIRDTCPCKMNYICRKFIVIHNTDQYIELIVSKFTKQHWRFIYLPVLKVNEWATKSSLTTHCVLQFAATFSISNVNCNSSIVFACVVVTVRICLFHFLLVTNSPTSN